MMKFLNPKVNLLSSVIIGLVVWLFLGIFMTCKPVPCYFKSFFNLISIILVIVTIAIAYLFHDATSYLLRLRNEKKE